MTVRVFIDGAVGTTGLEIRERLDGRAGIEQLVLAEADRKDPRKREDALNSADFVILCLPDDAAREAVAMIANPHVRVIDASTAHRVAPEWVYGFAELEPDIPLRLIPRIFDLQRTCKHDDALVRVPNGISDRKPGAQEKKREEKHGRARGRNPRGYRHWQRLLMRQRASETALPYG